MKCFQNYAIFATFLQQTLKALQQISKNCVSNNIVYLIKHNNFQPYMAYPELFCKTDN